MKQSLSPKQLAHAIGVSESSLKRWADDGRLNVTRTVGGHRRIDVREAIRFARQAGLKIVKPAELGLYELKPLADRPVDVDDVGEHLRGLLERGDAPAARSLLMGLFMEGRGVAWLCDGPIRRALEALGGGAANGSADVVTRLRAREVCGYALVQIRLMLNSPPNLDGSDIYEAPDRAEHEADVDEPAPSARPVAVGGAAPGHNDTLASLMAACVLAEAGFEDITLGPNVAADTLTRAAERYRPRVAWLSFGGGDGAAGKLDKLAEALRERGVALVLTGPGVPRGTGRTPGLHVCRTMAELGAFAAGLALA